MDMERGGSGSFAISELFSHGVLLHFREFSWHFCFANLHIPHFFSTSSISNGVQEAFFERPFDEWCCLPLLLMLGVFRSFWL